MAVTSKAKTVVKAAGVATAAAPYVRQLLEDDELRENLRQLARSASHLYGQVSRDDGLRTLATDDTVREDIDRIVASLQTGARLVTGERRRRRNWTTMIVAAGVGSAITAFVVYSRTKRS